jgi:hypothetical protein
MMEYLLEQRGKFFERCPFDLILNNYPGLLREDFKNFTNPDSQELSCLKEECEEANLG